MKKIELAKELANVKSQTEFYFTKNLLRGDEVKDMAEKLVRKYNIEELQKELDFEIERQKRARYDFYIDEFDTTEKGLKMRADMKENIQAWQTNLSTEISDIVSRVLGGNWALISFGASSFTIGIQDKENKRPYFGMTIDFSYDYDVFDKKDFELKANVGTTGQFDACESTRRDFYIGLGKLLASEELVAFKSKLQQYKDSIKKAWYDYDEASKKYAEQKTA